MLHLLAQPGPSRALFVYRPRGGSCKRHWWDLWQKSIDYSQHADLFSFAENLMPPAPGLQAPPLEREGENSIWHPSILQYATKGKFSFICFLTNKIFWEQGCMWSLGSTGWTRCMGLVTGLCHFSTWDCQLEAFLPLRQSRCLCYVQTPSCLEDRWLELFELGIFTSW